MWEMTIMSGEDRSVMQPSLRSAMIKDKTISSNLLITGKT